MKKTWLLGGSLVVVALAAGGGWMWLGGGSKAVGAQGVAKADGAKPRGAKDGGKPEVTLEFVPAEVVRATMARLPSQIDFSGPLVAPQTAVLRSRAGGTLLALGVSEGSRVTAGQVVGQVELADLASRLNERSAMLESARAAQAQAERTHANNERLAAQQFISPSALDSSRAALETARAQFNAAQASLETTRVGLRDARLVAPISGIVAKRHALPGEKLADGQTVLTIVDLARLELAGAVGTHEVSRVAPGMPVMVQVEGVEPAVPGRIARIAPAAEPGTRSIGVTIELPNPKEVLRAGQYALARVVLDDPSERLTLPLSALGSTSGQDHVWVIEDGKLARRAVTVGRRDVRSGRAEILSGVTPQQVVLGARFDNLREGAPAVVVPARSAPAASAAAMASAAASTPAVR